MQGFSPKSSVQSLWLQPICCNPSMTTVQSQTFSCNPLPSAPSIKLQPFTRHVCIPSVINIESQPLVPTLQSQPFAFSHKTSVATCLSLQSQTFSWKPSVARLQFKAFGCSPSVENCLLQHFSGNHSVLTFESQPFSSKPLVATLQLLPVCCNP